jgi:hypothetical protein
VYSLATLLLLVLAAVLVVVHRRERPDPKWQLFSSLLRNAGESGFEDDPNSKWRLN